MSRESLAIAAAALLAACGAAADAPQREPRPEMPREQRAAYVERLRRLYAGPPATWPEPGLDEGVEHREIGPLPPVETAGGERAKLRVALGRQLFFDPRLSGNGQIACASCHDPDLGWADGRTTSFGHNRRRLTRNAPSILNSGLRRTLFWDGRAASLEEQAVAVLTNPDEMHSSDEFLISRIQQVPEYVASFRDGYGVDTPGIAEVADALATFERTVVSGGSRFDRFTTGHPDALNDRQLAGLHLFRTDARCLHCHNGPLFTDDKFHDLGISNYGRPFEDLGRYRVTGEAEDVGAFRTPSLRNVTATRPYMHNGLFDIEEVLRLYNAGMPTPRPKRNAAKDPLFPTKSPLLKPLGLNQQDLNDLEAFLESLSESRRRITPPRLAPGLQRQHP